MPRQQMITFHGHNPYNPDASYRMIIRAVELIDRSTVLHVVLEHLDEEYAGRRVEASFKLPARPNSLATALYAACGCDTSAGAKVSIKEPEGKTIRARFALSANGTDWTMAGFEPDAAAIPKNASG